MIPNSYTLKFSIVPRSHQTGNISAGFTKMKYFAEQRLMNSVFISRDSAILPGLALIENNIAIFPTEPNDFYLGAVLFCKFLAITEKYFHIEHMTIDSMIGDHVQYTLRSPEDCDLDLTGNHWWNMDTDYTGSGNPTAWADAHVADSTGFNLTVVKGGRVEDQ